MFDLATGYPELCKRLFPQGACHSQVNLNLNPKFHYATLAHTFRYAKSPKRCSAVHGECLTVSRSALQQRQAWPPKASTGTKMDSKKSISDQ